MVLLMIDWNTSAADGEGGNEHDDELRNTQPQRVFHIFRIDINKQIYGTGDQHQSHKHCQLAPVGALRRRLHPLTPLSFLQVAAVRALSLFLPMRTALRPCCSR